MVRSAPATPKCSGMLNGIEVRLPTALRGACALTEAPQVRRTAPTDNLMYNIVTYW